MLEKLEHGLTPKQMMGFFPDRTYSSVNIHTQRLRVWYTGQQYKLETNLDPLIQRIIDMRVKRVRKGREIASELGIKYDQVFHLWDARCVELVSKEMLDQLYMRMYWFNNETEHIFELHRRATLWARVAALHSPSKTLRSFHVQVPRPATWMAQTL